MAEECRIDVYILRLSSHRINDSVITIYMPHRMCVTLTDMYNPAPLECVTVCVWPQLQGGKGDDEVGEDTPPSESSQSAEEDTVPPQESLLAQVYTY